MTSAYADILKRIDAAIEAARVVFERFTPGAIETEYKIGHDPVTEADRAVDAAMRKELLREGEGWLSEESVDDVSRLARNTCGWSIRWMARVSSSRAFLSSASRSDSWKTDAPLPEESTILRRKKRLSAPSIVASLYNGQPAKPSQRTELKGSLILASRSEVKRGEWQQFQSGEYQIRPMGSVAYNLGWSPPERPTSLSR